MKNYIISALSVLLLCSMVYANKPYDNYQQGMSSQKNGQQQQRKNNQEYLNEQSEEEYKEEEYPGYMPGTYVPGAAFSQGYQTDESTQSSIPSDTYRNRYNKSGYYNTSGSEYKGNQYSTNYK